MAPFFTSLFFLFPEMKVFRYRSLLFLLVSQSLLFPFIQPSFFLLGGFNRRIIIIKFFSLYPKDAGYQVVGALKLP
jgi:hypothetical protein